MIPFESGKTFMTNIDGQIISFTMTKLPLDSEGNAQDQSFDYGPYGLYMINGTTMLFEYCDTKLLKDWECLGVLSSDVELKEIWSRFIDKITSDNTSSEDDDANLDWFLKSFKPRVIEAVRSRYQN